MAERSNPPPADPRRAIAGSITPPATSGGPVPDPVEREWERLERERVAEEIAEAHEDVVEAITHPPARRGGNWVWWAFAAALLAGVVFAVAVNLFLVPGRQDAAAAPSPGAARPPSASESGPGIEGPTDDEPAGEPEPAAGA